MVSAKRRPPCGLPGAAASRERRRRGWLRLRNTERPVAPANVDIVRGIYERWGRGEPPWSGDALETYDPEARRHEHAVLVSGSLVLGGYLVAKGTASLIT